MPYGPFKRAPCLPPNRRPFPLTTTCAIQNPEVIPFLYLDINTVTSTTPFHLPPRLTFEIKEPDAIPGL